VILDENNQEKPEINYPTEWGFKIIGKDEEALFNAIKEVMGEKEHSCQFGNSSKNGKFCSYNAKCEVENQEERDRIFKAFQDHKDINMVI
jgi:putative lipoic acid-binding regulatory protein